MSGIYGVLGLNSTDSQLTYVQSIGQRAVYDAAQEVLANFGADLQAGMRFLVEGVTEDHKRRYMLPGSGRLQRLAETDRPKAVKATGSWDVAFPLEEFGAAVSHTRIAYAYATLADLDRHLDTVMMQDINTVRFEMLKAIFNNTDRTFIDPVRGSLTIKPLGTGATDGVLYPPVLGSESEQTLDRYAESGYAASAISDTNDPFPTIVNALEASFGTPSGGSNIVVFVNNAQVAKVSALAAFVGVTNRHVTPGDNVNTVYGLPDGTPGRVLGVHEDSGAIVVEWRWIPANYMLGIHLGAPAPLQMRVDPGYTNLPRGLTLVSRSEIYPFEESDYSHRFGFGVGNRLNGYVFELGTGGTYTIPTAYA